MKFTIELDIGLSYFLQSALPQATGPEEVGWPLLAGSGVWVFAHDGWPLAARPTLQPAPRTILGILAGVGTGIVAAPNGRHYCSR
jgi:hypothetical protein